MELTNLTRVHHMCLAAEPGIYTGPVWRERWAELGLRLAGLTAKPDFGMHEEFGDRPGALLQNKYCNLLV